jgi:outer membrane receptor protein involved in Fe transport
MDSWEVGVELRMLNNRLGLDASYFHNLNTDLLMSVPIAASTGFTSIYLNAASMEAKGIEFSVNAGIVNMKNFTWDFIANFTKIDNTGA